MPDIEALKAELEAITHPAAKIFRLLIDTDQDKWTALLGRFEHQGQQQPIILDVEGRILDGRNRWLACKILNQKPVTETRNVSGAAAVAIVIAGNIDRRHDDASVIGGPNSGRGRQTSRDC